MAVGTVEAISLPIDGDSWANLGLLVASNCAAWSIIGIGIAWALQHAGSRLERPAFFAVSIAVGAAGFSAVASWIFSIREIPAPGLGIAMVFPRGNDWLASFLYQAWIVAFYGGLFALAWRFHQRAERVRAVLVQARIAHVRTEIRLGESQLQALRQHVEPAFLLGVMQEVERRYAVSAEDADHLMNLLVSFLRLAMPGVRSGSSTLAAEVMLARAYTELAAQSTGDRPNWTVEFDEPVPGIPFPPLLLLPLLDGLASASTASQCSRLRVEYSDERVSLTFYADSIAGPDVLPAQLAYRIRVGLSTLFGSRWSMSLRTTPESGVTALLLEMGPVQLDWADSMPKQIQGLAVPPHQEMSHGEQR